MTACMKETFECRKQTLSVIKYDEQEAKVCAKIMRNMAQTHTLKSGIKEFGHRGQEAAFKEVK